MSYFNNVDFILMDSSPLAISLRQQTVEWFTLYGKLLHEMARTNMAAVQAKLDKFALDLAIDPNDLEDLKIVLQVHCSFLLIVVDLFVLQHECWITQYLPRKTVHIISTQIII